MTQNICPKCNKSLIEKPGMLCPMCNPPEPWTKPSAKIEQDPPGVSATTLVICIAVLLLGWLAWYVIGVVTKPKPKLLYTESSNAVFVIIDSKEPNNAQELETITQPTSVVTPPKNTIS